MIDLDYIKFDIDRSADTYHSVNTFALLPNMKVTKLTILYIHIMDNLFDIHPRFFGRIRVGHLLSFLSCVSVFFLFFFVFFFYIVFVLCTQCCQFFSLVGIVNSWLPLRFFCMKWPSYYDYEEGTLSRSGIPMV